MSFSYTDMDRLIIQRWTDVVGLIEIENSATDAAVATLVTALNETMGAGTYVYIPTGRLGTDVITNALIYQPASVRPLGVEAVLDSTVDPTFLSNNRPATHSNTNSKNSTCRRASATTPPQL